MNNNEKNHQKRLLTRLTLQETANKLGITKATVRTHELRALAKLRRNPELCKLWELIK